MKNVRTAYGNTLLSPAGNTEATVTTVYEAFLQEYQQVHFVFGKTRVFLKTVATGAILLVTKI